MNDNLLKFRLWDKKNKMMIYPKIDDLDTYSLLLMGDGNWHIEINNHEDGIFYGYEDSFDVMFYIGINDKNEKEIYEKDIIKDGNYSKCIENKEDLYFDGGHLLNINRDKVEIVGNTYETTKN